MNTKILLTVTSAALALAGVLALFAPELVAIGALVVYAVMAVMYGWLLFGATGLPAKPPSATTPKPKP